MYNLCDVGHCCLGDLNSLLVVDFESRPMSYIYSTALPDRLRGKGVKG
jgi:hypothetical protein